LQLTGAPSIAVSAYDDLLITSVRAHICADRPQLNSGVSPQHRMAKYTVLKSVAHNLGHSYLSLMNYVDGDYIVEHLFRQARETGQARVEIDVLAGTIAPEAFQTPVLTESVIRERTWFGRLVQSGGAALDMVSAVRMEIVFDFEATRPSPNVPGLELAAYRCMVEIVDDRGRQHVANVPEWWRY